MFTNKLKTLVILVLTIGFIGYSVFLYASLPIEKKVTNNDVYNGKLIWQKYNCNACHQIYGLGGYLGPDLTNIHSLKGDSHIRVMISSGINAMPSFNLSTEELNYLVAYLTDIDASGKSDAKTFRINKNGTIEQ
jgi:nitric oxide reductase subunit C